MRTVKHMEKAFSVLVIGMLIVSLATVAADARELSAREQMGKAQATLSRYVTDVLTERNAGRYGFRSLEEAKSARVGEPLPVMLIGLSSLKEYRSDAKVGSMLIDARTLWFPVLAGGETRTKLEMIIKDGALVPGEFGGIKSPERISSARKRLPGLIERGAIPDAKKVTLVRIPALAAEFLYLETGQGDYFLPAMVNPGRFDLDDGKIYPAADILSRLRDIAKDIDPKKVR